MGKTSRVTERLQVLGFQHKEFPDGWYWFVSPQEGSELLVLSQAMGFEEDCMDAIPETIIFQMTEDETTWQYVYGADYGDLSAAEALGIIDRLEELGVVFSVP